MPTFDQVSLQEAMLKTATGKTAQIPKNIWATSGS